MAELFNSDVGTANGVAANIPGGGLAMPSSLGGVIANDFDAQQQRINDLTVANKAKEQQQRLTAGAVDKSAIEEANLQKLATNVQSAYADIDTKSTNIVEANQRKKQVRTAALVAAGKGGYSFIKSVTESLETKREIRPDGMTNILSSNGEVIGVEGGDRQAVLANKLERHTNKVHEVFPNTIDTLDSLFQLDAQKGGVLAGSTAATESLLRLKNAASSFKSISDDYHVAAQSASGDQITKLTDNAQNGYVNTINSMMNTFMSPDMMNSIKIGSLDRSQVTMAMQQVRRDIMDEITTQRIPVKIGDIDKYIKTTMDDMNTAYNDVQKNDLISLDQADKTIQVKNSIRQRQMESQLGIPEIQAAAPMVDMLAKLTAAQASAAQAAQALEFSGVPGAKAQAKDILTQVKSYATLGAGLEPTLRDVAQSFTEANFDFRRFDQDIKGITSNASLDNALTGFSRITNHSVGWIHQPAVQERVDTLLPILEGLLEEKKISKTKFDSTVEQLGQYSDYAKSQITKAGYTDEQYTKQYKDNQSILDRLRNIF